MANPGTPVIIRGGSLEVEIINDKTTGSKDYFDEQPTGGDSRVLTHIKEGDIKVASVEIDYTPSAGGPTQHHTIPLSGSDPNGTYEIRINTVS